MILKLFFFILQLLRQIPVSGDGGGGEWDTEIPSPKVEVEPKVHTDLVLNGIIDIAPLQENDSPLRIGLREGAS